MLTGNSAALNRVRKQINKIAHYNVPVLIIGESGTGKEIVARMIHDKSFCSDGPFIPLHTGTFQPDLVMSELFGHEKGAFTGAESRRKGKLELADGGTLFLDEIATMETRTQIALLRVLESKSFFRLGGTERVSIDIRIVAATNVNLKKAAKKNLFRQDLLYRISGFEIKIPPLRRRKKDIPALIDTLIAKYSKDFNKEIIGASRDATRKLLSYPWPGNVRELQNALQQAVITSDANLITVENLPDKIRTHTRSDFDKKSRAPQRKIEELECRLILETLEQTGGNREESAKNIGISRKGLYNKMKKYGLLE